jgi:hypothetical protein
MPQVLFHRHLHRLYHFICCKLSCIGSPAFAVSAIHSSSVHSFEAKCRPITYFTAIGAAPDLSFPLPGRVMALAPRKYSPNAHVTRLTSKPRLRSLASLGGEAPEPTNALGWILDLKRFTNSAPAFSASSADNDPGTGSALALPRARDEGRTLGRPSGECPRYSQVSKRSTLDLR